MRRVILRVLVIDALVESAWVLLRWTDNKRKGKTVSDFWTYMWIMWIYGEVNGRVPLADIEREWRKGTWFEQTRGKRGWQGPTYVDTPYGTLKMGKKIVKDTQVPWPGRDYYIGPIGSEMARDGD